MNALLRHLANAYGAGNPTPSQQNARDWRPEALRFPAVDPDTDPSGAAEDATEGEPGLAEAAWTGPTIALSPAVHRAAGFHVPFLVD